MILIGLGSNLTTEDLPTSEAVLKQAIRALEAEQIKVIHRSRFYETEPVPKSDQPWFVNAVIGVETDLDAVTLLNTLHDLEYTLGRRRRERWEARIIDLDLLCHHDQILPSEEGWYRADQQEKTDIIFLPHPRLHERHFVLEPLAEIAPTWRHPVFGKTALEMLASTKADGIVRPLSEFPEN